MLQSGCMAGFGACFVFSHRVPAGSNSAQALGRMRCLGSAAGCFLGSILPCLSAQLHGEGREQVFFLEANGQSPARPSPESLGCWVSPVHPNMLQWFGAEGLGMGSQAGLSLCHPHASQGGKLQCRVCRV